MSGKKFSILFQSEFKVQITLQYPNSEYLDKKKLFWKIYLIYWKEYEKEKKN